ncbi:major facilitator superfamily domain-containing protein [Obelidium mucronatum]|nr:major facilitator superfamily domain-containing protein [Obelidium mucronatum]
MFQAASSAPATESTQLQVLAERLDLPLQDSDLKAPTTAEDAPMVILKPVQFIAAVIGSLDVTIFATALKAIVGEFGDQELVPWIASSYMMLSASSGILYGKLSDVFGRRPVYALSMFFMLLGSLICAVSQNMQVLIVGRAISGFGCGGIQAVVLIILTDLVTFEARGKYQSLMGATIGLSMILLLVAQSLTIQAGDEAGSALTPTLIGLIVATIACGIIVSKTGNYTRFFYFGPLLVIPGTVLCSRLSENSSNAELILYQGILGLGLGTMFQMRTLALQSSVAKKHMATATSIASTLLALGGAVGVAMTGTILNNLVDRYSQNQPALTKILASTSEMAGVSTNAQNILALSAALKAIGKTTPELANVTGEAVVELAHAFNQAFETAMLSLLPFPILILVLAFVLRNIKL